MIWSPEARSADDATVRPKGRRGRAARPVPPAATGVVVGLPRKSNPNDWLHRHHDSPTPISWTFASARPAIGRLVLDAIHDLSGVGRPIAFRTSALSYQTLCKPFLTWLADAGPDEDGDLHGATSTHIPPALIARFRTNLLERVNAQAITEKTAYRYDSTILRVLKHAWQADPTILGPDWREEHFMPGEYDLQTTPHEPYGNAEAQRILRSCTAVVRAGVEPDGLTAACEAACLVVLGLKLGIEPECLGRLTHGDVRADGGGRLTVTYIKRRGGGGNGFRKKRTTNRRPTSEPDVEADERETVDAPGDTFADAGGVLALLRDKAAARATGGSRDIATEPLFTIAMIPDTFARLSDILHGNGLIGDDGSRLAVKRSRLRPTWRVQRTIRHAGRLSIDRSDNTPDVRSRHYLENERMTPFLDRAVLDGQEEALRHATSPTRPGAAPRPEPIIVPDDAALARLSPPEAAVAASGEQDLWLASCRDFTNTPHDDPGRPCTRAFHGCLGCGNAIVTRRSLPFIVSFQHHIEERRRTMATDEWESMFGETWRRIVHAILPEFDPAAIAEAHVVARGKDLLMHLPPELRA